MAALDSAAAIGAASALAAASLTAMLVARVARRRGAWRAEQVAAVAASAFAWWAASASIVLLNRYALGARNLPFLFGVTATHMVIKAVAAAAFVSFSRS
jgi:hypothetical protein